MTSIRHTRTLFEYDGHQLFEARDDEGAQFLALMIGHVEGRNRHLVVEVTPDRLEELKAGLLDLKEVIAAAGSERWFVVWSSDLTSPLVLEPMSGPIPSAHLPEAGFRLSGSVTEKDHSPPANAVEARERLVEALNLDLVGPWAGHRYAAERLRGWTRPSNWYLTGFLIPANAPPEAQADRDEDDDLSTVPEDSGLAEESAEERKTAKKGFFPSSIGLSFLADAGTEQISVQARWGDYERREVADGKEGGKVDVWERQPQEHTVAIALRPGMRDVPSSGGMKLSVAVREVDGRGHAGQWGRNPSRSSSLTSGSPMTRILTARMRFRHSSRSTRIVLSCQGPTFAAHMRATGTNRWLTCTTPTRPSTRRGTGSLRTGILWTAHVAYFVPRGFQKPRSRERRRFRCVGRRPQWRNWASWTMAKQRRRH